VLTHTLSLTPGRRHADIVIYVAADDPLLSVAQIARLWGTGLEAVTSLVISGALPSLDRGELIRRGELEIPLIRESWAEFMRIDSPGAERILAPPAGSKVHPAARRALALHAALESGDADSLWALSSQASHKGHNPESLLARWSEINHGGYPEGSGVGTTIYSLAPLPAVGARVFANAPKSPRTIDKPTPATLLAVLPFVWENEWVVDLPIYSGEGTDLFLPALLTTPPPEGANLDPSKLGAAGPPQSPSQKD
jgi:hypothetical protein